MGAGPGAADLITVRGLELIKKADIIVYAGSLVSKDHLKAAKQGCLFYNSAEMALPEIVQVLEKGAREGKLAVRLHTGDPSIYGAIGEQMKELDKLGLAYQLVPGVSSFTAASAAVKKEMTLPGLSQTIIITRLAGRTPVPEDERLQDLASHGASMAIFLSVQNMDGVVEALEEGYGRDVAVAVVYKASWPEEKIVRGTLADIAEKVEEAGISRQAMILVGDFLEDGLDFDYSKLYDETFSTDFRQAER